MRLTINPAKFTVVLITRRRKLTNLKTIQIFLSKNFFGTSTFGKLPEAWQERPGVVTQAF